MNNKTTNDNTEKVLEQVHDIVAKLHNRTTKIDFDEAVLKESSISDLKLHLGYTKAYSDLAKVKLQYYKVICDEPEKDENEE